MTALTEDMQVISRNLYSALTVKKTSNTLGVLLGREVEMFELVLKIRQRQHIVLDRKSVPSRRSSMTEHTSSVC